MSGTVQGDPYGGLKCGQARLSRLHRGSRTGKHNGPAAECQGQMLILKELQTSSAVLWRAMAAAASHQPSEKHHG